MRHCKFPLCGLTSYPNFQKGENGHRLSFSSSEWFVASVVYDRFRLQFFVPPENRSKFAELVLFSFTILTHQIVCYPTSSVPVLSHLLYLISIVHLVQKPVRISQLLFSPQLVLIQRQITLQDQSWMNGLALYHIPWLHQSLSSSKASLQIVIPILFSSPIQQKFTLENRRFCQQTAHQDSIHTNLKFYPITYSTHSIDAQHFEKHLQHLQVNRGDTLQAVHGTLSFHTQG